MSELDEDKRTYKVVVNDEGQYSIWLAYKPIPLGWRETGKIASKTDCLQHIDSVWTDMRPLSLQRAMASAHPPDERS